MMAAIKIRYLGVGLFVLAIGVIFLFWSQIYPPRMSGMPTLVAWITIALALIDIAAQFDTKWGLILRRVAGMEMDGTNRTAEHSDEPSWARIGIAMLWVAGYVAAIYVFGLLATTPIYIFLYMFVHGKKSVRASALSAVITTAAIWFTFEYLFHYPLYPGVLFGGN